MSSSFEGKTVEIKELPEGLWLVKLYGKFKLLFIYKTRDNKTEGWFIDKYCAFEYQGWRADVDVRKVGVIKRVNLDWKQFASDVFSQYNEEDDDTSF